ncbi:MAG: MBL fold metallo-hydrolase [Candidatus Verstraetearchaeota archaeon]|nr:MBL fold metallo-hydrolase [Candidatus Verstraetearchaeota archaeon]
MVNVTVFGAGREVGRSGFEVKGEDTKLLLDYGVLIKEDRPVLPLSTSPKDLNGIIITHAHLDHSGSAPMLYVSGTPPVYMTNMTRQLTDILIRDLLHLSAYYIPFEALELKTMIDKCTEIRENGARIGRAEVEFHNSGHIPGSVNVLVNLEGKGIWYSGDINTIDTALLNRARIDLPELDMAIIESTYATVEHAPRDENEKRLIEVVNDVVEGGGLALIPAFSVGRSQELLCVLQRHGFKYDIAIDGMSRTATRMVASRPEELRDPALLKKAMSRIKWVAGDKDRKKIVNKPGVVIASSGMLSGGASIYYMEKAKNRSRDCVILVSFQVPGTPGRTLLDEGLYGPPGELRKVKCRTEWINFSSHCGRSNLMEIVRSFKGNPKILCVHGEAASCMEFAERIKEETGHDAYAPAIGNSFTL